MCPWARPIGSARRRFCSVAAHASRLERASPALLDGGWVAARPSWLPECDVHKSRKREHRLAKIAVYDCSDGDMMIRQKYIAVA